ncbi:MAG: 6-bladed beta-propeller [Tannerellaceae bacterium]|jgi:hypothetical protein|nr:6-bladed beta-propeller [Tannerellaceae bacterium]
MKTLITLYALSGAMAWLLVSGCTLKNGNESDGIPFDLSASYPEKAIMLEELADMEYLQLESDNDFLFDGDPDIVGSDKIIISRLNGGDILVFSRNGKPLSTFNRLGNGPEDYPRINKLIYDDTAEELYVISPDKIRVYTLSGEFRRAIALPEGAYISEIVNYDATTLLLYDDYNVYPAPFTFISKEDGHIVQTADMPKGEKITLHIMEQDKERISIFRAPAYHIVKYKEGYLLSDFSLDTVFFLSAQKELQPALVRKPEIRKMEPIVYLNSFVEAGGYVFASSVTVKMENNRLPRTYLMQDRKTGLVYRQRITWDDYQGKQITISPETIQKTQNDRLGLIVLDLEELKEANRENKLGGKLKQLVDSSDMEGNNIYMLLHFK